MVPEEWPSRIVRASDGALQNPAYRLADILSVEGFGVAPDPSPFLGVDHSAWRPHCAADSKLTMSGIEPLAACGPGSLRAIHATIFSSSAINASGAVTFGE